MLAGSPYRIGPRGTWQVSDPPGRGRESGIVGATITMRIDRPHAVDTIVPVAGRAWPPGSRNYRYSRRYGYVERRDRLVSPSLDELMVLVDLRRRRVVEVLPGPNELEASETPLPGQCPVSTPPPD